MRSVNCCTFIGNVGAAPKVKFTPGGSAVAEFSIALNSRAKKDGEYVDQTEWVNLKAFGKTAEIVDKYADKGKQVYVRGKLQTRSWEKDGVKQYRTEVVVDELILLGSAGDKTGSAEDKLKITDEDTLPF